MDHVGQIFVAHAAEPAQRRQIAPRKQIEMRNERLHRGIEAVALLELDGEAFRQIARAHARRIEPLQDGQHGLDRGQRGAQLLADHRQIADEVTSLIDEIDKILPDHAPDRIGHRQRELPGEMVDQRGLHRNEGFEIVVAVVAATGAGRAPVGIPRRRLAVRARRRGIGIGGRHVLEIGTEPFVGHAILSVRAAVLPVRGGGLLKRWAFAIRRPPVRLPVALPDLLQQRIALELALHISRKVQVGELQQLDGLHQLRRHHERVALTDFESLGKRHVVLTGAPRADRYHQSVSAL